MAGHIEAAPRGTGICPRVFSVAIIEERPPRANGDLPLAVARSYMEQGAAPRGRGSAPAAAPRAGFCSGYPARTGICPIAHLLTHDAMGPPRTDGDLP